jgi:prolyl oligopeptidase
MNDSRTTCAELWSRLSRGLLGIALVLFAAFDATRMFAQSPPVPLFPPVAAARVVTEEYFGTKVSDPYRYMEKLEDSEVQNWFKQQNAYTRSVLSQIPGRTALLEKIKQFDQTGPPRIFSLQRFGNDRIYYEKRLPDEDVAKLYVRTGLQGREQLLVDPNRYATKTAEHFTLNYYVPSYDGRYVAYGVSPSGSEDAVIHILDTSTGRESGETIDRSWYGGISWLPDQKSFLHIRFQKLAEGADPSERRLKSRVLLHRIGTDPESDLAVFGYGVIGGIGLEPSDSSTVVSIPGVPYALAIVNHGFDNDLTVYRSSLEALGKPGTKWQKIIEVDDGVVNFDVHEDDLYLITHKDAPRFKIVLTSLAHPDLAHAHTVVPSGESVMTNLLAMADALYVQKLDGGIGKLWRMTYPEGPAKEILLPVNGSVELLGGDPRLMGIFFALAAWTKSSEIYAYVPESAAVVDTKLQQVGAHDDPADLDSVETKTPSYDGTMVPLSIIFKKGIKLDGSHPTLLTGYGAYSITFDPYFSPRWLAWLERGGVLAIGHVRGGGEYGEEWHRGGMLKNKPNTWRDFIACAEYLIKSGYTSPSRLGGQGGSAGGILIGRAFTERPDLFAAVLDDVGLSDMIRDMFSPDGPLNVPEYGDLKNEDGFRNLFEISAYYHVKEGGQYPGVLITTGMNDPRVVPWEPGKMAARLQAATGSKRPVLLRVDYEGGHGTIGGTRGQEQELLADQYSFLLWQFGEPGFQFPFPINSK